MKLAALVLLIVAVPLATAAAPPQAQKAGKQKAASRQAQRDWVRTVEATPEGGFRMGNPDAPTKLVEFVSMTCPTCAHFHAEAFEPLKSRVASGQVSYEVRNFVLNGADVSASLLARCGGTSAFFERTDHLLRNQEAWFVPFTRVPREQTQQISALPTPEQPLALARAAGFDKLAAARGINAATFQRCVGDRAAIQKLVEMRRAAAAQGVRGTPSFMINGQMTAHIHSWTELEALLGRKQL